AILKMLERNPRRSLASLRRDLPTTYQSPTMSPKCSDEEKYNVIDRIVAKLSERTEMIGQKVVDVNTVNGVRIAVEDGTWGLIRASSNKPELVVVVESPASEEARNAMFGELKAALDEEPEVGAFNQTL
ncbi:MAG: phosphomannomutase/phosphoglucomutase, partial [Pseudomonadota bacterium]